MPKLLRSILAIIAGIAIGSAVNMALVALLSAVNPPPEGMDPSDAESIRESMHLFEPRHFVTPLLAHALGTLAGALATFWIALRRREQLAYGIGAFFLIGGIAATFMIPAPMWFVVLDLVAAYIPMAWLAIRIGRRVRPGHAATAA